MTKRVSFRYKKRFRLKKRRSIFKSRFFWFASLFFAGLFGLFYLFLLNPFFEVKEIKITGVNKVSLQDIKNIAENKVNNKILFLNSKSIFLVDLREIGGEILSDFLWVSTVKIKRTIPDALAIEIKERAPAGTWCQGEDCFYFDKTGVIFAKSEDLLSPLVRSELPDFKVFLGKPALEEKYISSILEIYNRASEDMKLGVKDFVVSGDGKKLEMETTEGWRVLFDSAEKENVYDQIVNLSSVLKEKILPENRKNLDYIDLRFGSRVFYKYQD